MFPRQIAASVFPCLAAVEIRKDPPRRKKEKSLFYEKLFRGLECARKRCSTKDDFYDDFYKVLEASLIPRVKKKHNLSFKMGRPAFFCGAFFIPKSLSRVKEKSGRIRKRGGEEREGDFLTGCKSQGRKRNATEAYRDGK